MFLLGFLVGALLVAAVVAIVLWRAWSMESEGSAASLLARQRIEELERQTIARMLREAEAERRLSRDSRDVTRYER